VIQRLVLTIALLAPGFAAAAKPVNPHRVKAVSWNRAVTCTPYTATAADVHANRFAPGIGNPATTTPPCSTGLRSTFVQLHKMRIIGPVTRTCTEGETVFCDTVFTAEDPVAPAVGQKPQRIRCVIDQAWKRAALAPPDPGRDETIIEIQGFVYRNPATNEWEIHPVTAWK